MRITSKGFQFLLEDVNTQLWDLLLVYLEESQVRSFPFCRSASKIVRSDFLSAIGSGRNDRVSLHARFPRARTSKLRMHESSPGRPSLIHDPALQAYLTDNLSDIQLETLRNLADYGLAYLPAVSTGHAVLP